MWNFPFMSVRLHLSVSAAEESGGGWGLDVGWPRVQSLGGAGSWHLSLLQSLLDHLPQACHFPRSQHACCLIHFPVGTTVISNHQKWKSMLLFECLWYEIRKLRKPLQNHKDPSHSNNNNNDNTTYCWLNLTYYVPACAYVTWLNCHMDRVRCMQWSLPFYSWGNWGTERFTTLPKVTQLVSDKAMV